MQLSVDAARSVGPSCSIVVVGPGDSAHCSETAAKATAELQQKHDSDRNSLLRISTESRACTLSEPARGGWCCWCCLSYHLATP